MNFAHPDDHALFKQQLIPNDVDKLFECAAEDDNGELHARTEDEESDIDRKLKEDKRLFRIR